MFTYTSFQGAYWAKYHRILFNLFAAILVLINTFTSRSSDLLRYLKIHTVCVCLFTVYVIVLRPYRCWSSNTVYIIAMLGLSLQVVALTVTTALNHREDTPKLSEQTQFLMKTLFGIFIFVVVLLSFFVIVVVSAIKRVRWPIDYSFVKGKETAIA